MNRITSKASPRPGAGDTFGRGQSPRVKGLFNRSFVHKKQVHPERGSKKSQDPNVPTTPEERAESYAIVPVDLPNFISFLCRYVVIYETLICVLLILNLAIFPYDCFYNVQSFEIAFFVYTMDIIYSGDVILRLLVEEWRSHTQVGCMVLMIPYRLHYCLVDVISLFPFQWIPLSLKGVDNLQFHDLGAVEWWQVPTMLRVYRIYLYFSHLEANGLLYESLLFVIKFTLVYLAFILGVSVIFFWFTDLEEIEYFLLTRNREKITGTWAQQYLNQPLIENPSGFFILTTTFATVLVTTVGYGDISPYTEGEMFGSILVMLVGAIIMSGYFQSQITSFCLQLDGARLDLFHRLDGVKIALHQAAMGDFFVAKVEQYYQCLWTYREGVDRVLFIHLLPTSFQGDVSYDICLEMFHKSYLFHGLDEAFLRSVSKIVTIALYNPGMIVCRYGGYANKMYYIIQGECQAMSKHDTTKRAAILRAGSIIGETNLFFSCPYTISVETRGCCQLMCLDKEELMRLFNKFQNELSILRSRCQKKIDDMYYFYEKKGEDPVCWVEIRQEAHSQFMDSYKMGKASLGDSLEPRWPDFSMRWGYGFNDLITEDVILDAEEYVIFDNLCDDKNVKKNHVTPYVTCVVPEILSTELAFIRIWNLTILICALMYGVYGPYCLAFYQSSLIELYVCRAGGIIEYVNDVVYIVDVFVEILGAAPVEGLYYKFRDGLNSKKDSSVFYLDLLAAIPLSFFQNYSEAVKQANVVLKSTKIWKVIRYLHYLDNIHPKHVFWFRLMQTCLVLVYGIHFIACTVYIHACPKVVGDVFDENTGERDCTKSPNWLWSYILREPNDMVDDTITVDKLASNTPYLISFFYASATLTSAGFGDFHPQDEKEMIWATVFTLVGFFLICYYTSILTSALSCTVKPKLEFQQKLVAVRRFMHYYNLPHILQRRVVQFYELQHQARHGINLPHGVEHFMFDAPDYLKNDYLYTETVIYFDSIPLFSKVEPKYIIKMADMMRRFLIPPNVMFLHRGEVRRAMYIIQAGSVGVYEDLFEQPKHILEATSHFGIRDLLFGEPSRYTFQTLSYCNIFEITNDQFVEVFEEDTELLDLIDDEREQLHDKIEEMANQDSKLEREKDADRYVEIPSWIHFRRTKNRSGRQGRQYHAYAEFFKNFRGGNVMRHFLEKGVVHPVGPFAKWWCCWMSLVSCLTIMLLFMETFMYLRTPTIRVFQWILDSFFYVDIYIKLHWGYFAPKTGLLISHPLKTAGMYIFGGSFVTDVVFCTPVELLMFFYGKTNLLGYGEGASWYTKLRWIRFVQIKRIPQIFAIVHGIFVQRTLILLVLFVTLTVMVCTIVGSVALYIACPWQANNWTIGDEYRLPACREEHWVNSKFGQNFTESDRILGNVFNRWIFGVYYVSQVLLVIGFGDMITLQSAEIFLLILMSVFGFVFVRCVLADMTSAEVDSDEIRARYTDAMKTLIRVMEREKLSRKLVSSVHDHLNNMWKRSKGLQPAQLFNDLHPSLESDVFRSYVGDTLRKVAAFKDFTPNVLRTLCLYLKKLHFLRGERLMRFGNLEYDMYIIVSGKVWITDKRLSYGCTLGKYETFGESSMLTYAPRRYSAIAATDVEVFVIARIDFDALIERYPKVKNILNSLLSNGDYDYFEYKIYEMIDRLKELEGEERDKQISYLQIVTNEIKLVVSGKENLSLEEGGDWRKATTKNRIAHYLSHFIDYGSDNDGLGFLYFVGRRHNKTGRYSVCPPLIHPNCGFIKLYLNFVYTLCFLSPALAMYEYCFSEGYLAKTRHKMESQGYKPQNTDEQIQAFIHRMGHIIEYFLVSYMAINMITPYQNEQGQYIKSFIPIALKYIFAPDGIWLDLVASVPGYVTKQGFVILATRSIRLFRFYSSHLRKRDDLSVSPFRSKIQISVSSFILMAHYIACLFYKFSNCEDSPEDDPCFKPYYYEAGHNLTYTWTYTYALEQKYDHAEVDGMHRWRWWLRSLYWVISVISTTGFGDIVPQNVTEMILGILCFFAGAFILSIILSSFTAGMTSITRSHREYLYQVKLLVKYLNNVGLSAIRQAQTNIYFALLWEKCRGRMYHEVTVILPTSLRIEVCNAIYFNVLDKVALFSLQDPVFIKQVAARVSHSMYLPGICIVKEGDLGNSMFVVFRGRVSGIKSHDTSGMELKKVYMVGDSFGKLPCLFHNEWYRKSYRAEEVTEVLELQSRDVIHLASVYPEFWRLLKAYVEVTYDAEGPSDCIFSPQRARQKDIYDLGEDYRKNVEVGQQKKKAGTGSGPTEGTVHNILKAPAQTSKSGTRKKDLTGVPPSHHARDRLDSQQTENSGSIQGPHLQGHHLHHHHHHHPGKKKKEHPKQPQELINVLYNADILDKIKEKSKPKRGGPHSKSPAASKGAMRMKSPTPTTRNAPGHLAWRNDQSPNPSTTSKGTMGLAKPASTMSRIKQSMKPKKN